MFILTANMFLFTIYTQMIIGGTQIDSKKSERATRQVRLRSSVQSHFRMRNLWVHHFSCNETGREMQKLRRNVRENVIRTFSDWIVRGTNPAVALPGLFLDRGLRIQRHISSGTLFFPDSWGKRNTVELFGILAVYVKNLSPHCADGGGGPSQ